MRQYVSVLQPFLLPNNIPWHGQTTFDLSIHKMIDRHLSCLHFSAIMNNATMNIHVQAFVRHVFSYLESILGVELLGLMLTLCRRQWHPTPALLPGESQGRGSLLGCHLWGRTESDMTEAT